MKKIIALILTSILCVSFFACDMTDADNESKNQSQAASEANSGSTANESKEASESGESSDIADSSVGGGSSVDGSSSETEDSSESGESSDIADSSAGGESSEIGNTSDDVSDTGDSSSDNPGNSENNNPPSTIGGVSYSIIYLTFEEACKKSDTIVTATFIKSEQINSRRIRHDFTVKENLLGKTEKIISVYESTYAPYIDENGQYWEVSAPYNRTLLSFESGVEYLLPLRQNLNGYLAYSIIDAYYLTFDLVIRLDKVSLSTMYCEPLSKHARGISISDKTTKEEMLAYVKKIAENYVPEYVYIDSDNIEDIVKGSEHIVKLRVESAGPVINGMFELSEYYKCTITEELKGNLSGRDKYNNKYNAIFLPGTIKVGDVCIVAVYQSYDYLIFTSKNSLFTLDQEEEIKEIIAKSK